MFFLSCDAVLEFYGSRPIHICKGRRDILPMESEERERERERVRITKSIERQIACCSVVVCFGLYY